MTILPVLDKEKPLENISFTIRGVESRRVA